MKRFLLFFALYSGLLLSGAETVLFDRPLKAGDRFDCMADSSQSQQYTFRMPGVDNPPVRLNTVRLRFAGLLTIEKVNAGGKALNIRLEIRSLRGSINGRKADCSAIEGKTVTGDLSRSPAVFRSPDGTLNREAVILLSALFRPVSTHSLAELTGRQRTLERIGETWSPDLRAFSESLRRRGIDLPPGAIKGTITYAGKETFRALECFAFRFFIQSKKTAGYDFRFSGQILFPVNPEAGPAGHARRHRGDRPPALRIRSRCGGIETQTDQHGQNGHDAFSRPFPERRSARSEKGVHLGRSAALKTIFQRHAQMRRSIRFRSSGSHCASWG